MSWCNVAEFKLKTGIVFNSDSTINDVLIQEALDAGVTDIQTKVFIRHMYQATDSKIRHILTNISSGRNIPLRSSSEILKLADWNANKIIDVDDLNIFEIDKDFVETDLSSDVVNFIPKYGVIEFGTARPSANKTLVIEFEIGRASCRERV